MLSAATASGRSGYYIKDFCSQLAARGQVGDPAGSRPGGSPPPRTARRSRLLTHPCPLPSPCLHPPAPVQGQSLDMRRSVVTTKKSETGGSSVRQ